MSSESEEPVEELTERASADQMSINTLVGMMRGWYLAGMVRSWYEPAIAAEEQGAAEAHDRILEMIQRESTRRDTGVCLNPPDMECDVCEPGVVPHPEHDRNQWQQAPTFDQCKWIEINMKLTPRDNDIIIHIDEALRDYDAEVLENERAQAERMKFRSRSTARGSSPAPPEPEHH